MSALTAVAATAPLTVAANDIPIGEHKTAEFLGLTFNLDTIWATVIAGIIVIVLGFVFRAKVSTEVPGKLQLAWEALVDWVRTQTKDQLGELNPVVMPMAATFFVFILVCNWFELIPTGEGANKLLPAPTADVNLVFAMGVVALLTAHAYGLRRRGLRYFAHYKNPLEIITELAKFISLPLRLFGNIFAGGLMISLIALLPIWIFWLPTVVWKLFDMGIGALQAFIFALLTILYWGQLGGGAHDDAKAGAGSGH